MQKFSAQRLHTALDGLLAAYEDRGIPVSDSLLPPLDETQLRAASAEWVSHPQYSADGSLPHEIELAIWRKHNPGIFVY